MSQKFISRPSHRARIHYEAGRVQVLEARISDAMPGGRSHLPGAAVCVDGQARLILPIEHAWKLSDALADLLSSLDDKEN